MAVALGQTVLYKQGVTYQSATVVAITNSATDEVTLSIANPDGSLFQRPLVLPGSGEGQWAASSVPGSSTGEYGTGADGALVYDGAATVLGVAPVANVYTLTRSIYPTNMTISTGVTVDPDGYEICGSGTLDLQGTGRIKYLANNGAAGAAGSGGAGGAARPTSGVRPLPGSNAGAIGGAQGGGGGGASSAITNIPHPAGTVATVTSGNAAGTMQGGAGGKSSGGTNGGTGGSLTIQAANQGNSIANMQQAMTAQTIVGAAGAPPGIRFNTGSGGGGGRGGDAGGSGAGGGGGASGGYVNVRFRFIIGTGTIEAPGGNGGSAQVGGTDGAGGAGGGGGVVNVVTSTALPLSRIVVTGGTGGGKNGTATVGGNGGDGVKQVFNA